MFQMRRGHRKLTERGGNQRSMMQQQSDLDGISDVTWIAGRQTAENDQNLSTGMTCHVSAEMQHDDKLMSTPP